jgi:hypothetical protein
MLALRYAFLNTNIPPFSWATSFISAVNFAFFSSSRRYGVKYEMQSLVLAFGVFRNHSITIWSSSSIGCPSGPSTGAAALRFFGFGGPPPVEPVGDGAEASISWSSGAFLLLFDFADVFGVEPMVLRGDEAEEPVERIAASPGAIWAVLAASGLPAA